MSVPPYLFGRRAALGAVAVALATAAVLTWALYATFLAPDDPAATDALDRLARLQAEAAALPQLEAEMSALKAQLGARSNLLPGDSDALAQAALQSDVKAMAEVDAGEVRSAFALPPVAEGGLTLVSVQFDIVLPIAKLRALAYAIESRSPDLFLSSVDLAGPQTWPTDGKAPEPQAEIRWTVSGYRRGAAP